MAEFFAQKLDDVKFVLNDFEGPLDLLLTLIKDHDLDILTVKLSELTDQYMRYMEQVGGLELDKATEFLVMAATMLQIKSNNLLPKEEESIQIDDDPEMDLRMRLLELDLFREKSADIKELETINRFYVEPVFTEADALITIKSFNMDKLLDAYAKLLLKFGDEKHRVLEKKIEKEHFTVRDKFITLMELLKEHKRIEFADLFDSNYSKNEIITTFLALLELLKRQFAEATQAGWDSEIYVEYKEGGIDVLDLLDIEESV